MPFRRERWPNDLKSSGPNQRLLRNRSGSRDGLDELEGGVVSAIGGNFYGNVIDTWYDIHLRPIREGKGDDSTHELWQWLVVTLHEVPWPPSQVRDRDAVG